MYFITILSAILLLISLISSALEFENNPIITVNQGAIANEGLLPIHIFWYHPNFTEGDMLLVYSSDGRKEYAHYMIESATGFYELSHTILEHGESSVKYCGMILSRNGTLSNSPSCKSKVQWMYDRRNLLKYLTLSNLIIPGTHQSAAYAKSDNETLEDRSLIARWVHCQSKSIKSQLMEGIRYLDLRPGFIYVEGGKKYIVTHNVMILTTMDDVVKQINEFLDLSKDIVIVSFREFFKGFVSYNDHLGFIKYLEHSFERYVHPFRHWTLPLSHFWDIDRRLVIVYDHAASQESDFMWPAVPQYWANSQTINQLHSYFDIVLKNMQQSHEPWALMAHLSHSFTTVVHDTFKGDMSIRHWAEKLGRCISQWFTDEWHSMTNIVAVDFYETSGIVDLAIQYNEKRAEKQFGPGPGI